MEITYSEREPVRAYLRSEVFTVKREAEREKERDGEFARESDFKERQLLEDPTSSPIPSLFCFFPY